MIIQQSYSEWSPGSHTVNGHVEKLPGPDDGEEPVDALKDGHHHLVLVLPRVNPISELIRKISIRYPKCRWSEREVRYAKNQVE
jgi:hypothetical protein